MPCNHDYKGPGGRRSRKLETEPVRKIVQKGCRGREESTWRSWRSCLQSSPGMTRGSHNNRLSCLRVGVKVVALTTMQVFFFFLKRTRNGDYKGTNGLYSRLHYRNVSGLQKKINFYTSFLRDYASGTCSESDCEFN